MLPYITTTILKLLLLFTFTTTPTTAMTLPSATPTSPVLVRAEATPAYTPIVTPAPDQDAALASMGFTMVTYYTCLTRAGEEHCGWHVPVLRADGARHEGALWAVMAVAVLAGGFVMGLL